MSSLLYRVKSTLFVVLIGTSICTYAEYPHGIGVAKEVSRPKLELSPILYIDDSDEAAGYSFITKMLGYNDVSYKTPVPHTDKYAWQREYVLNIPPLPKRGFKDYLCKDIEPNRESLCNKLTFHESGRRSEQLLSLGYVDILNESIDLQKDPIKVLIIAGTHGDEPSSVTLAMNWLDSIIDEKTPDVYWRFIPALNPDGLLSTPRLRTNARGVDLNRNMPTLDWKTDAKQSWVDHSDSQQRFFPGEEPASEAETRFLVEQIDDFSPDMIVSIHAPYNLVDYDFSSLLFAPPNIGHLKLHRLGSFPGSLGRYCGFEREIPTLTIELEDARHVPTKSEYQDMLVDLVYWVNSTHEGTSVVTMPSTRKEEFVAQNTGKPPKTKSSMQSESDSVVDDDYNPMPLVTQPYIIKEHKKIDVVPVIL